MPVKIRPLLGFSRVLLLGLLAICLLVTPAEAAKRRAASKAGQPWWQSSRYAGLVINADNGDVLYSANAHKRLHPASLTKMMTLYVVFSALDSGQWNKDTLLPVSAHAAAASPTKLNLRAGDQIRVEDAIKGLVTCSANDAAITLAEGFGGTESNFARIMTDTAQKLGMNGSTFYNASGLPNPNQYSTARDMATLALALQKHYPQYFPYFSTTSFSYRGRTYNNHNHLMERYEGMDGIKTGFVNASGFNLVSSVRREGIRLVGVVFGGSSAVSRDQHMAKLLDNAFYKETGHMDEPVYAQAPATIEPEQQPANFSTTASITDKIDVAPAQSAYAAPKKYSSVTRKSTTRVLGQPTLAKNAEAMQVKPAGRNGDNWRIQVGAFKSKKDGQQTLAKLKQKWPTLLNDNHHMLTTSKDKNGKPVYRAQMAGFSKSEATTACTVLKKNGQSCYSLPPA